MKIKRYIGFSLLLAFILSWYIYAYVSKESLSLELLSYKSPEILVSLLVILPFLFLMLMSVLHMSFYAFCFSLKEKKYKAQHNKFLEYLKCKIANKEKDFVFSTEQFKELKNITDALSLNFKNYNIEIKNEKIKETLFYFNEVNNGVYVSSKKFSFTKNSEFYIKNIKNKFKQDEGLCEWIFDEEGFENLKKEAYLKIVKNGSFKLVKKYKELLNNEAVDILLIKFKEKGFDKVKFENLIENTKLDGIKLSKSLKILEQPDVRLEITKNLSNETYFYTLLDLEMLSDARSFIDECEENFAKLELFLTLREENKTIDLELFT